MAISTGGGSIVEHSVTVTPLIKMLQNWGAGGVAFPPVKLVARATPAQMPRHTTTSAIVFWALSFPSVGVLGILGPLGMLTAL